MDPVGVLAASIALLVYPGALFVLLLSEGVHRTAGLPEGEEPLTLPGLAAAAAAAAAVALAALPGSPSATLPPDGGAPANLIAVVVLLAVAAGLGTAGGWPRRHLLAAAAALVAAVSLPLVAATTSVATILSLPGTATEAARLLAALTVVAAVPAMARPGDRSVPVLVRSVLTAASLTVGLSLAVLPALAGLPGAVQTGALAAAVLLAGLALRIPVVRAGRLPAPPLVLLGSASVLLSLLASRGG